MKKPIMVIDVARCHDCNNCFMSCKDEYYNNEFPPYTCSMMRHGQRWMNIQRTERGDFPYVDATYLTMPCQQCQNAPCIEAGKGAVTRREDGIVMIDIEKAKGMKELVDACPYGAISWNEDHCLPQKCSFCAHLLDEGWTQPRCAQSCPTGALTFHFVEDADFDAFCKDNGLAAYKAELGTNPHVLYKNLYRFTKHFVTGSLVLDGDCAEGEEVTLKLADGSTRTCITNTFGDFKFDDLEMGDYTVSFKTKAGQKDITVNLVKSFHLGAFDL
ncbi:MAG: oxidoreductase [Firmicutes bacterium]|nr:oxidoreductase [Bacillota bacterium]